MTHAPDPDDNEHALCGKLITRNDATTTREDCENVDCLPCLIKLEEK